MRIFFENKSTLPGFRTVVSLHGQTLYSREVRAFVRGVQILHAPPLRGAFRTMLGGRRGVAL
jgi:hypothetical protein